MHTIITNYFLTPLLNLVFLNLMKWLSFSDVADLVKMFPQLSFVLQNFNSISFSSTIFLMKWCRNLTCFDLPWNPRFFGIAIVDIFSQKSETCSCCKLANILRNHTASHAAVEVDRYYALGDESDTKLCFFEHHEMILDSKQKTWPDVLFWSSIHLAQSLSVYRHVNGSCRVLTGDNKYNANTKTTR